MTPANAKRRSLPGERGRPFHFAGRAEELSTLHERLDILCKTRDPGEGMALVTGVPGIGKTQLGRKFVDEARRRDDAVDVRVLDLKTISFEDHVNVFLAIGRALGEDAAFREIAALDAKITGGAVTVNIAGLAGGSGSASRDIARHTGQLPELLETSATNGLWDGKALVVAVDEVQNISAEGIVNLCVLHEGVADCPIMVLGLGLQHAPDVLSSRNSNVSISRKGCTIKLKPLTLNETLAVITEGIRKQAGIVVSEETALELAKASQNFPQHIHGYLVGAIRAIDRHGGLENELSLTEALRHGHKQRTDYYDGRLASMSAPLRRPMLSVVKKMRDLDANVLTHDQAACAAGGEAIDEAVRHGVLTVSVMGDLSFGIPSFHDHMSRLLDDELPSARMSVNEVVDR